MKSLFIYHWLFRLVSPIFSGIAVYALILLSYGDLETSFESIQTPELYLCIGLTFILQELIIFQLRHLDQDLFANIQPIKLLLTLGRILALGLVAITIGVYLYYHFVLAYLPAQEELILFNTIYGILIILYSTVYLSHGIIDSMAGYRINSQLDIKKASEEDFNRFVQDLNPSLLTTSLESIIVNLHHDEDKSDHIVSLLSQVYRYLINGRNKQLITIREELNAADKFVELYNQLPYRNASLETQAIDGHIIPGTLIYLIEEIIKCAIPSDANTLQVKIQEENGFIYIRYQSNEKLNTSQCEEQLEKLKSQYRVYSERTLNIYNQDRQRTISIPVLIINE